MDPLEPVNILLVDDQPAKLLSYEAILADLGENLVKASSGRDALEVLLKQDIAIEPIEGFEPAWNLRLDNPGPAMRKHGRKNGNAARNNAKPGKPSHARRTHAQRDKGGEHTAAKKQRRSWRDKVNSHKA